MNPTSQFLFSRSSEREFAPSARGPGLSQSGLTSTATTGFNNRVVNPALQPLKGYWTVIENCGMNNEIWNRVLWSNNLPIAGCSMEVFVRASNNRQTLANQPFTAVSNNAPLALNSGSLNHRLRSKNDFVFGSGGGCAKLISSCGERFHS